MMRPLLALIAFVALASNAAAAPISFSDLLARPRAKATEIIHYGAAPHQFGELWLPSGRGPFQTVVLIHGGCWLAELPGTELMAYIADDLKAHDYAVWSIDYRRIGEAGGGYPGTFQDVAAALDKLRTLAPAHKLDLSKLVAVGHSAGGHLALWAAARSKLSKASPLLSSEPLPIQGVVSLAGIADLKAYRADGPEACGGPETIDALVSAKVRGEADVYADTSPAALLPIGIPQVTVSGALDPIVPPKFGLDYAMAAASAGDHVRELTIQGAGHFELIDPTSDAWTKIRNEIDVLTGRLPPPVLPTPVHPHN